jgi:class 3 adenylate cyclase
MRCRRCGLESPKGMRFCGACGEPLDDTPTGGNGHAVPHRRHMTALFCDIVDSTPIAESLDAEDFRDVLRAYRQACVRAVQRFDGYMADHIGDGVVAFFGYPSAHEDDAHRAVHAALAVLDEIAVLNPQLAEAFHVALRVRIGLHTGVVVAGEVDADDPRAPVDVVGPMPHIAARLQTVAPPDSVVISDTTHSLVDGWFETERLGEKALKGVARPLVVHRVVRSTGAVGRLDAAAARRLTPVVGRAEEIRRLVEAREAARAGRGTVVHVRGEAGIGKSRLVHALAERGVAGMGTEQIWQCSPHHRNTALYPVVRLLESRLAIDRSQPVEAQLAVLADAIATAGLDPGDAVPLLADLLSISGERETAAGRTPLDARTALLHTLEALLVADAPRRPLRLVVEDVHWADPTTVELLGRIVAGIRDRPVLCVMTFRPELEPPWAHEHPVVEIDLGPLSAADVRAMANAVGDTALDSGELAWVEAAADGVPLFVEEMVKMLGREGAGAA